MTDTIRDGQPDGELKAKKGGLDNECHCPKPTVDRSREQCYNSREQRYKDHAHRGPFISLESVLGGVGVAGFLAVYCLNEVVQGCKSLYYVMRGIEYVRAEDENESSFSWYERKEPKKN